jgi:hypothetical protein
VAIPESPVIHPSQVTAVTRAFQATVLFPDTADTLAGADIRVYLDTQVIQVIADTPENQGTLLYQVTQATVGFPAIAAIPARALLVIQATVD